MDRYNIPNFWHGSSNVHKMFNQNMLPLQLFLDIRVSFNKTMQNQFLHIYYKVVAKEEEKKWLWILQSWPVLKKKREKNKSVEIFLKGQ